MPLHTGPKNRDSDSSIGVASGHDSADISLPKRNQETVGLDSVRKELLARAGSDPSVAEEHPLATLQQELAEKVKHQQVLINGTIRTINYIEKNELIGGITGAFLWASGGHEAVQQKLIANSELKAAQERQLENLKSSLKAHGELVERFNELKKMEAAFLANGDSKHAALASKTAESILVRVEGAARPTVLATTSEFSAASSSVTAHLAATESTLKITETVLRTTRDVAIATGVTVATGGTALAIGGATGVVAGVAAGTAYGTAVGAVSATAEGALNVVHENRTVQEALGDIAKETGRQAKDAAITSVATVVGVGAAGKVSASLGTTATSSVSTRVLTSVVSGSAAGASGSATASAANAALHRTSFELRLQNDAVYQALSPDQRREYKNRLLDAERLGVGDVATSLLHDTAVGAISGALGGATTAGKLMTPQTVTNSTALHSTQAAGDVAIGVMDAAIQGDLSPENVSRAISGAVAGTTLGAVASQGAHSKEISDSPSPTRGAPAEELEPAVSYHIDDYRARPAASPPEPRVVELPLRAAAGAESLSLGPKDKHQKSSLKTPEKSRPPALATIEERTTSKAKILPSHATTKEDSPIRNVDAEIPTVQEVRSFLESEKLRNGDLDPTFKDYTTEDLAELLVDTLKGIGSYGAEGMLLLRSERRLGTMVDGVPLRDLINKPQLLIDAVEAARKVYTDTSHGPVHPIRSSYPSTQSELASMNRVIEAASTNLAIDHLEVSEHRGRFGGLEVVDQNHEFTVRYDPPHTLKYGRVIPANKTKSEHGPGSELSHLDVEKGDSRIKLRYFEAPDGHIYQYDSTSGRLYQKVGESSQSAWKLVSTDHNYYQRNPAEGRH